MLMKKLSITIMHKLPHRVRLKLSEPIKNLESFKKSLTVDGDPIQIKYSPVTKTVIALFDVEKITLQEVIYKVVTAFSIQNGMMPVKLMDGVEQRAIDSFAIHSGAAIVMAGINKLLNRKGLGLQERMNWFSMGMTSVAIFEHAYKETSRKGVFDLEILPALYLIKSFLNTPSLSIVAMTWLTTFGRHMFSSNNNAKEVKLFRIKNKKENRYCYIANVTDYRSIENIGDLINQAFFYKNKGSISKVDKFITINN